MIALVRPECPNPKSLADGNYKHKDNKEALRNSTYGKCMYCESRVEHNSYANVEHIKPKSKFPELEFAWNNLGYSCERCNTNKGHKFNESISFINPYDENPEEHIEFFGYFARAKKDSKRGSYTIDELKLNRAGLIEKRKEKIYNLKLMLKASRTSRSEIMRNQIIAELKKETEKDKEFSALAKCFCVPTPL
jgi:uncharacterized protein (TIGR02646 family)